MIYLLRKHDIISVPIIREAYIICEADIIPKGISSVPTGTDIIKKDDCKSNRLFLSVTNHLDANLKLVFCKINKP